MNEAHTVELNVLGHRISFVTKGNAEIIAEAIDLATLKLQEAQKRAMGSPAHKIAILALLEVAEEYVRAKHRLGEHRKEMIEKSSKMMSLFEDHVQS